MLTSAPAFWTLAILCMVANSILGDPKAVKKGESDSDIYKRAAVQRPPKADTCPCVRPPNGGGCVVYDSMYQAATLEEAVTNFFDLAVTDPSEATTIYGQKAPQPIIWSPTSTPKPTAVHCSRSSECLACFQALTERLTTQWSATEYGAGGLGLGLSNLSPLAAPNIRLAQQCKRLTQASRTRPARPSAFSSLSEEQAQYTLREYLSSGYLPASSRTYNISTTSFTGSSTGKRDKRDGPSGKGSANPLTNTGITTPLDCSYSRGDPVGDDSGYVGLCNLCWSLRTLSPKYFPRYINELSCHQSDKGCLRGLGKCRERFRSIDVLYNSGTDSNPKWQQYSINSPISCECQVIAGSTLHGIVDN